MTIKATRTFLLIGFACLMGMGLMAFAVKLVQAQATAATPAAVATTITVNTDADELNSNNNCSLREAIVAANTDTAVDNCPAGSGADTITFADNYTITLTSALPDITTDLTIDGEGAANTIVQASTCNPVTLPGGCTPADWRVFTFTAGASTLKDLTVRYGNCDSDATCSGLDDSDGGNIYASNGSTSLTLDAVNVQSGFGNVYGGGIAAYGGDLTIQNNSLIGGSGAGNQSGNGEGGGIHFDSDGRLLINHSEISYNQSTSRGGGVNAYYCGDQLHLEASTISNNFTDGSDGGGLWTDCTTTINDSTISGNTAEEHNGGGVYINSDGVVTITNSTFADNQAATNMSTGTVGGAIYNNGTLTVVNSTLYNNFAHDAGGGIYNETGTTATLVNNTFAENSAFDAGDTIFNKGTLHISNNIMAGGEPGKNCDSADGSIATDINNLIENNLNCGTPISTADPNLGLLQDNGGATETMALLTPSPAINAGDDTVCADAATVNNLDQRGVPRPFGTHCDVGAFEFSAGANFIVNTDADTDDGSCDAPGTGSGNQDCTLREAINGANADNTGAHEITFAGDYTITLTANLPNIT
ncbi:MAG: CSLREA domain-containing protein, partial [Anaerolineales bacterium]|nr:CSLREA domain-containing protein [Anaerolineales bacterium]